MISKTRAGALALFIASGAFFAQATEASAQTVDANASVNAAATCAGSGAIDSVTYTVDGVPASSLSAVQSGSTVVANFNVKLGCTSVDFGLAAYEAPSATWDPAKANLQKLKASDAGNYSAGAHSLSVTVPDCYYQVDFFTGSVIGTLTASTNYSSEGRLISFTNGGSEDCSVGPNEVTTTTTSTTVVPETTTTTVPASTTTTVPDEVLDTTITTVPETTTTTAPPQVLDETLARTGSDVNIAMLLAGGFVLVGATAMGAARRRRNSADNGSHWA